MSPSSTDTTSTNTTSTDTPAPPAVSYRPTEILGRFYRSRGPVVTARLGRERYVYLLGPDANRFVISHDDLFEVGRAFQGLVPVDGPTSLIVSDGPDHRRRRRLVQPALHHRQVSGYLSIMASEADTVIDSWTAGRVVDGYADFRSAIRRSTMQSLFGSRLADDADFFGVELQKMLDLIDRLPQLIDAHRRLRTPLWRGAESARTRVDERVHAEIERARTSGTDAGDHVLATLVHGRDDTGDGLSDAEVRDQVVTLIAAGYETTSAAMGWALYNLAVHPAIRQLARDEVQGVLGNRAPEAADLEQLPYLRGVVQETLRLYPPAVVSARDVVADFDFAGRQVAAGSTLLFSPYVTHRLGEVFEQPLAFRPERWLADRPGYRKPGAHEFLPFGGGTHRCIGSTMATTELTVMLTRLLQRADFELMPGAVRARSFTALRPRGGLRLAVTSIAGQRTVRP